MNLKIDLQLLFTSAFIIVTGLLIHHSLSPTGFNLQLIHLSTGIIIFLLISQLDLTFLYHFRWHLYFASLIVLIITLLFGRETHGAVRWLTIGNLINFQPSEIIKVLLIFSFAGVLSTTDLSKLTNLTKLAAIFMLPVVLILLQPNLSTGLILVTIFVTMVFASGVRFVYHLGAILAGLIASPFLWHFLKDYQKNRILTFLDPSVDPLGRGYNSIQAIIAVGSGQLFGRGLGHGTQSKLRFLPEHQTDFIFAALAEEAGFIGSLLLLSAYSWLILRLYHLAGRASSRFSYLTIIGITSMFAIQTFISIGMNIGILPVTGITLPLLSAGGSSIVASITALAVVNNLAHKHQKHQTIEIT